MEPYVERSSVAMWQRLAPICGSFDVDVSCIYVDETMYTSRGYRLGCGWRTSLRRRYSSPSGPWRQHTWTDDADRYREACRLEHHVYPQERKNLIERRNQTFKDGAERFDGPCFREGCKGRHVHKISAFRFHYVGVNEETGRAPLQADGLPEYQAHAGGDGLNLTEPPNAS